MNILWLLNNKTIDNFDGIIVSKMGNKISTVAIDSVQENHAGVYSCLAENAAGKTHFSVELNVNGNNFLINYSVSNYQTSDPSLLIIASEYSV